jgi:hypothetical protein
MSYDARQMRDLARQHGHQSLTEAELPADAEAAATLAALAVRITGATGFYRPRDAAAIPIITFGPVTITASDETTSIFTVDVNCPE